MIAMPRNDAKGRKLPFERSTRMHSAGSTITHEMLPKEL